MLYHSTYDYLKRFNVNPKVIPNTLEKGQYSTVHRLEVRVCLRNPPHTLVFLSSSNSYDHDNRLSNGECHDFKTIVEYVSIFHSELCLRNFSELWAIVRKLAGKLTWKQCYMTKSHTLGRCVQIFECALDLCTLQVFFSFNIWRH